MKLPDFYSYPAIFTTDGDGWEVFFPDVDNAFTAADSLEQAIIEARYVLEDIMYLREKGKNDIPVSTPLNQVNHKPGDIVQIVVAVMPQVRREFSQKSVKKTLSIPSWMEEELKKRGDINISQLLQNAIRQELHLS
ncbi:MAG: type II toxin-antitoxin system HicB family antitoxin [Synergistaceae bacterium]|jgi:predicted RNase H-like HicB family nuclease|nr:type II toxin-antitoxin system HicB family antitoxin [Synergistaceae bacterium]